MTEPLSHYVKHGFVLHDEGDTCQGCRTPLTNARDASEYAWRHTWYDATAWLRGAVQSAVIGTLVVEQFPHCDSLTLHRPGSCAYCDGGGAALQRYRLTANIPFSGEDGAPDEVFREREVITRWPGNRATTRK